MNYKNTLNTTLVIGKHRVAPFGTFDDSLVLENIKDIFDRCVSTGILVAEVEAKKPVKEEKTKPTKESKKDK